MAYTSGAGAGRAHDAERRRHGIREVDKEVRVQVIREVDKEVRVQVGREDRERGSIAARGTCLVRACPVP